MKGVTEIGRDGEIFAIVLRRGFTRPGTLFFTPPGFSLQLGLQIHPKGRIVGRHRHKPVRREILQTQEALVLLEGRIRVELFDEAGAKLKTVSLKKGEAVLLARGGHKVTVLEKARIVIVKQGPQAGSDDKEFV